MKEKAIKEGLERLLKEQDSQKVGEVFDRMVGQNQSIPDRLWVLWTRVKGMTEEAEDLSSLLEYHSGSRLSQVIDHLKQAETLISETMSLTTGQAPSEEFGISEVEGCWEVWDYSLGIGIRFPKWDGKSQTRLLYVRTAEAYARGEESFGGLLSFARERFPQEFKSMVNDPMSSECL